MNTRAEPIRQVAAVAVTEGAGVTVHRTIGSPSLQYLDPFMLLDHFGSDDPDEYIAGFPSHPHRGFSTFTYMLDGHMEHQDSMGNTGNLGPGSAQLMKAASGVIHSEMPRQENGLMRGFQLWINLPAANKMDRPEYQEFEPQDFPGVETDDYTVKLIIGHFADRQAPITDDLTHLSYLDVRVKPHRQFRHTVPAEHNSFLYLFEGEGLLSGQQVAVHTLNVLGGKASGIEFTAGESGARFIVASGRPIGEPIERYGPFVMNTREEIIEAIHDYRSNTLVRDRAGMRRSDTPGQSID